MKIDPDKGSTAGNLEVTISGGRWDDDTIQFTSVMFGEVEVTSVKPGKPEADGIFYTTILTITPPHIAGKVQITVVTPADEQKVDNPFTYEFKAIKAEPNSGKIQDVVIINGDDLASVNAVKFGDKPASFGVISASHVWAIVPDPGIIISKQGCAVKVTVNTPHGEAETDFKYNP